MAGLTNQIATELAAYAATVLNVRGASPVPLDTIPGTPYVVIGGPHGVLVPASWEQHTRHFTMHYLLNRTSSEARDQTAINDALDLVIAAFRSGITLGGIVTAALIDTYDTNKFYTVGATDYQSIDFEVTVEAFSAETYTA